MTDEERIELARRINDAFMAADFAEVRRVMVESKSVDEAVERLSPDGLGGLWLAHLDPNIEVDVELPGGGLLADGATGFDGWLRFWREWLEPWESLQTSASNYTVDGDRVLVDLSIEGEGDLSGAPARLDLCQVWTIPHDKVVTYAIYPDRAKALAADYRGA